MRQTTVYAGVSNLVQYSGAGVQSRDVGKFGRFYTTFMVTTKITRLPNLGLAQAITITEISV